MTKQDYKDLNEKLEKAYEKLVVELRHKIALHEERWQLVNDFINGKKTGSQINDRMIEIKEELRNE